MTQYDPLSDITIQPSRISLSKTYLVQYQNVEYILMYSVNLGSLIEFCLLKCISMMYDIFIEGDQ